MQSQPATDIFRSLFEKSADAILLLEGGIFTDCNEATVKMMRARNKAEFLSLHPSLLSPEFQPDGRPSGEKADEMIRATLERGSNRFEWMHRRVDGEDFPVEVLLTPIAIGDRQVIHTVWREIIERKQAETVQKKYQELILSSRDGIASIDMQGNVTDGNASFERITGYTLAELKKMNLSDLTPAKWLPMETEILTTQVIPNGFAPPYEKEYIHKDGHIFPVELAVYLQRDEAGNPSGFWGFIRDITERKQAEEKLAASERTYRGIFNSMSEAIYVQDAEGRFVDVNDGVLSMYGYSREEFIGKTPDFVSAPGKNNMNIVFAAFGRAFEGEPQQFEFWGLRKNGETFPKDVRLYPGEFFGQKVVIATAVETTERKKLEQEIQTSLEKRERQMRLSTQIAQSIAAAAGLNELYERVVSQVKEQFDYYHTQLLRFDPARNGVALVTGYGEIGTKMLAAGHIMPMGSGLIGTVAAAGETILRPTLENDPDWQPNPLLPETKGEIAVPIKMGDIVLGVLDVQSNEAGVLSEDDQILLEGLCGQIAIAIESTRLREEANEKIEETARLYRVMSREGWQSYRQADALPAGFVFDSLGVTPLKQSAAVEASDTIPISIPGGETIGALAVENDPSRPFTKDDRDFLSQIAEQVALALESARLFDQTQSALAQSEKLFEASRVLTQAQDLQGLTAAAVESINIRVINRAILTTFNYDADGNLEGLDVIANWWGGTGMQATVVGTHYTAEMVRMIPMFVSPTPLFFDDAFSDERVDPATMNLVKRLNLRAVAVLPLHAGARQTGVLMLEGEEPHNFTEEEKRLFVALGPQVSTVLENRRQFERAQKQAEREAMLNVINQKIQSATSVEAVLQIAARELGHALGAPMTVAQLTMKDSSS